MTRIAWVFTLLFAIFGTPLLAQGPDEIPDELIEELVDERLSASLETLKPQTGEVKIDAADATLNLGEDYVFYGPQDAETILVKFWGNPPESTTGVLGMVMPAGTSPMSDSWGAVITYEDTGYVSDEDAQDTDYDELMETLQEGAIENNKARREAGFQGVEIVGWAETPKYDAANHTIIWAQDLKFDGQEINSLNYDLRLLGRRGILSMNLVSKMSDLDGVRKAASTFAAHAEFDEGARYQDFDSTTDRVAEYGVGGLVAAGVGVAAAKKLGFFAVLLKFLKPLLLGLFVFFAAFRKKIFGFFNSDAGEEDYWDDEHSYYEIADDEDVPEGDETKSNVPTIDGKPIDEK